MQCPECGHTPNPEETADPARCPACGIYYHKALARRLREVEELKANTQRQKRRSRALPLVLLGLVVLTAGLGFGWVKHQEGKAIGLAKPSIKVATAYLVQQLGYHGASTNVTFAEYFEKAKLGIDEIDKDIIRLSSTESSYGQRDLSLAVEYMRVSRDTLRDMSGLMRSQMQLSIAKDAADRAEAEKIGTTNTYIYDAAKKRELRAMDEQIEALGKLSEANASLKQNAAKLLEVRARAVVRFGDDVTVPIGTLESIGVAE